MKNVNPVLKRKIHIFGLIISSKKGKLTLSLVEIFYKGEIEEYFDYGKVFYDYKFEKEFIKASFKIEELRDKFISFLEVLNVKCKVEDDGWLVITRVPEQS
ncbi:hypothetical protein [Tenacibaculum maritimum]|uniref:hypothetical protein n=1 Tax=Tenacibaculum maritimum TaxID=107401 RepID=UPI0012E55EFF|nr:hypothetical protein [Tenacibaculum maritimum]CAA0236554.1 hypothetical protein JIP4600_520001 [Tenacibaculum maritimum]